MEKRIYLVQVGREELAQDILDQHPEIEVMGSYQRRAQVRVTEDQVSALKVAHPELTIVPLVEYHTCEEE